MQQIPYNRIQAVRYAKRWALSSNPAFYNYVGIGGDCTNFVSQCVYAGCGVMNFTPTFGWYYRDANDKSPSWTGVDYFYNFMTQNEGVGPFGEEVPLSEVRLGDVIQLSPGDNQWTHSVIVTLINGVPRPNTVYVCAHAENAYMRRLDTYTYTQDLRCIHIIAARKPSPSLEP